MDAIPSEVTCAECAEPARRVFTSAALGRGDSQAMRILDATRSTAENPSVVRSVPGGDRNRPITTNPLHRKLPRA